MTVALLAALFALQGSPAPPSPSPGPLVGDVIPAFDTTHAVDGTPRRIDFPKGSSTVVIFFLSSCPHCRRMFPDWNAAFERKDPKLNVVAVMLDQESPTFFQVYKLLFPVVHTPNPGFAPSLKIKTVPVTLRVEGGGKITEVAVGEVDPITLGSIFRPAEGAAPSSK